jgi:hypothetical protein
MILMRKIYSILLVCNNHHSLAYPFIVDSGANFHMFKEPEFFTTMNSYDGHVLLGDGCTKLPILGIGTVNLTIDDHPIIIHDVRFVASLSESMYSLFYNTSNSLVTVYSRPSKLVYIYLFLASVQQQ